MKGEFCTVKGFKPSARTKAYIAEMNDVVDLSTTLGRIIKLVPFFQIFAGRNTYTTASFVSLGNNVYGYNWSHLKGALGGVAQLKRDRLSTLAYQAMNEMSGEERKFWRCTYNAL